jgi:hypothetical protein
MVTNEIDFSLQRELCGAIWVEKTMAVGIGDDMRLVLIRNIIASLCVIQ